MRIKGQNRDKKLEKRKKQMIVNGRSLKSVILPLLAKKAKQVKDARKNSQN